MRTQFCELSELMNPTEDDNHFTVAKQSFVFLPLRNDILLVESVCVRVVVCEMYTNAIALNEICSIDRVIVRVNGQSAFV